MKKFDKLKKKQKILLALLIILISILIISISFVGINQIVRGIIETKKEEIKEITYKIYKVDGNKGTALITFGSKEGISTVSYKNSNDEEMIINCNGKNKVAIDYEMEDGKKYEFNIKYETSDEKTLSIDFEIPRIQGVYSLKNGIYVNEPDISTGFIKEKTRFLYLDDNGNLVQGNWLVGEPPENWYNYKNENWANIYVEDEGVGSYYVWIPRYCYKIDVDNQTPGNQRMDVKFINVYNEYIDGQTGEKTSWEELEKQGYQIPEAFYWGSQFNEYALDNELNTIIPGYWISKYELSDLTSYIIDYAMISNLTSIEINNIKINTSQTISEYVFALDGVIYGRKSDISSGFIFENVPSGNKVVNVTGLNQKGEIVASMTKTIEVSEPNEPELSSFDPDTTFYVYWDEKGNEYNQIPISKEAPENWYNYSTATWANIVTRNNGLETYFVWIPRYEYKLNQISQRSYVKFLKGTTTQTTEGYKIPEAFWWDSNSDGKQEEKEQLTGYWITKYELTQEEKDVRINAEMSAGSNLIRVKDITGTLITNAQSNNINVVYEYYINGELKHKGTSATENYIYEGLNINTTYTINIIARNANTNAYIGAVTKKITTKEPYAPDISKFDKNTTYYVVYDKNGNETRTLLSEQEPENWYDYANQTWANIVTTANGTQTYFVWIPRYEYKILTDRANLSTANRRIDVNFITTDITNSNCSLSYKVPEAFWWDSNSNGKEDEGEQLTGYWITKYELNNN